MFYKWLRVKIVLSEMFDISEKCGANRASNLLAQKVQENSELSQAFEFVASCHGEDEFQKAADRWHSALFRWVEKEYGEKAAYLENQIDQILLGRSIHIV